MGIPYPCFYGDVINKATEFKFDRSKLVKSYSQSLWFNMHNWLFVAYFRC